MLSLSSVLEALLVLCVLLLAYVHLDVYRRRCRLQEQGIPVLSQLLHFGGSLVNLLPPNRWILPYRYAGIAGDIEKMFATHNTNIVGFVSYGFEEIFTNDPKLVQEVAVTRAADFPKPSWPYQVLRLFGENVMTAVDERGWKKHRLVVGPAFSEGNNILVAESTVFHTKCLLKEWKASSFEGKRAVDVNAEAMRLGLAVLGQAGLGLDLSANAVQVKGRNGQLHQMPLRDALQYVCRYLLLRLMLPWPLRYLPFGVFKVVRVAFDEFRWYMKDLCDERAGKAGRPIQPRDASPRDLCEEEKLRGETKRGDLLSKLLEHNTRLTTDELFADIFLLLLAGHETTAHTIGWAMRLLALHPDKQEKLRKEVVAVLGDKDPTYKDFERLVYARCIFKETLRLFPQVPSIVKCTTEATVLAGYHLPAQTMLDFQVNAIHRNPAYWDKPEEFRPERFDDRLEDYKPIDPCAFIPFAVGSRSCVGAKFAQVEGTLALAMMIRDFSVELPLNCTDRDYVLARMTLLTTQPMNELRLVFKQRV